MNKNTHPNLSPKKKKLLSPLTRWLTPTLSSSCFIILTVAPLHSVCMYQRENEKIKQLQIYI